MDKENTGEKKESYKDPLTGGFFSGETGEIIDYASREKMEECKVFYEVSGKVVWK